ncbi:putative quinol monooxygenase [Ruegeria arenilitoris]|uniref:putative quinol monooxygenase n=1 Tax=Ruegeria arenilitoris TaxID=1173585 RepID=UPI00147D2C3B|nr:putative quinol monooxygenase [Ruegeria arenilitoris]
MAKVYLQGFLDVPEDKLQQVRSALPRHIELTRAEPGCISFEVVEDTVQPGRFNVSEVFENQEAFDAHQSRTKASDWFTVTQGVPRDYTVKVEEGE